MNKNIIISTALIAGLGLAGASTYAATSTNTSTSLGASMHQMGGFGHKGGGMGRMGEMTDTEKAAFEAMSDTEKKAYMERKHTEAKAKHNTHEAVIDKLLAGQTLTVDEEALRQTIITERAAYKVKQAEMETKHTQIEAIIAKKTAGTTLTADEQTLLDSMPKMGGRHEKRGNHDGMMMGR